VGGRKGQGRPQHLREINLSVQGRKSRPEPFNLDAFSEYREARVLATEIAQRDRLHEDVIFSDAMHVAATLALENEGMPYTMPNVAWMLERVHPKEVRDILLLRRGHPEAYKSLPMAGATECLSSEEVEDATELAKKLTPELLNAFFFSDRTGSA
jgi:hypothetical protein